MRHDPHPEVLKTARAGDFRTAMYIAYRLHTGETMPIENYHAASAELDEIFGAYENLQIACTKPAAAALAAHSKMTTREAEQVSALWLVHWRAGRNLNCPKSARRPDGSPLPPPGGEPGGRQPLDQDRQVA